MATYIKKAILSWPNLWNDFGMTKDNGDRWFPTDSTPEYVKEFLQSHREPSRRWPNSYALPLLTQKFAKCVVKNDPELAIKLKIAE
jgi:hypothetical protein